MITLRRLTALVMLALFFQQCSEDYISPSGKQPTGTGVQDATRDRETNQAFAASINPVVGEFVTQSITLEGAAAGKSITINWGDGTIETYVFADYFGTPTVNPEHTYTVEGDYRVTITGDLKNITGISDPFTTATIHWMNFDRLPNLVNLDMPYNDIITLDVSKNRKLESLYSPPTINIRNVILPEKHNLSFVSVSGPNISAAVIDAVISNIYKNAVRNGTYNGQFDLASIMSEDPQFPGPPSEESMEMLRELRDVYGWTIFPNP